MDRRERVKAAILNAANLLAENDGEQIMVLESPGLGPDSPSGDWRVISDDDRALLEKATDAAIELFDALRSIELGNPPHMRTSVPTL